MFETGYHFAMKRIRELAIQCGEQFPDIVTKDYVYGKKENCYNWTEGFWTGMLWLAYEETGDEMLKMTAENLLKKFEKRIRDRYNVDHHDLGFLYSLSCVAAYKVCGDEKAKSTAVEAADLLMKRFREKGQFIQAWGKLDAKDNYRLIIDCLMNLPLLFWASTVTGDSKYQAVAVKHLHTTIDCVIREDDTTYHTYFFDPETGKKLRGETAQGYSNESCWARGQAWGVYGLALAYSYTKEEKLLELFEKVTDCFISRLPEDYIPYWDMIFTEGNEPRDTSAAVIAVCGILEMERYRKHPAYMEICRKILETLQEHYLTGEASNAILSDCMYSRPAGCQPEASMWGDYFYVEALVRMNRPEWKRYW